MDFHGINASVRTGIYSMVPLTPAFPMREIINVSSATAAYADPRAWDGKNGGHTMLTKEDLQAIQNLLEPIKQDISEVKESLAEVREATNYIAKWVEAVESKVKSIRR